MIQRSQSIYLLLGALALVSMPLAVGGLWEGLAASEYVWFVPVMYMLMAATVVLTAWAIFLYSNRKRQRTAVVGVQALNLALLAVLAGAMYLAGDFEVFTTREIIGVALPVVAYIFFYLARRAIESDIKLVESMDRLRE